MASLLSFADFVNRDCVGDGITPDEVEAYFPLWFNTGNSTFVLFNERVDDLGFLHQNYQQYVDGIKVEDCALFVHSKDGYVSYINGDIMPIVCNPKSTIKVSAMCAKKKVGVDKEPDPEIVIIYKQLQDTSVFYKTYKVITDTAHVYIDAENGDIIATYPTINYTMKNCTIPTIYSGAQNISCNYTNNKYYLYDSNRQINVRYADMLYYTTAPENSYSYTSTTKDWSDTYLSSVTIQSICNDWWGVLGLENPDLYIEVLDNSGNQLYITDYKEDVKNFPVTFRFSKAIRVPSEGGLKIRIYDDDISEDQLGTTVTISAGKLGTHSWGNNSSNTSGSLVISNSVPSYDAYWGSIKTYDFYKNIFGLNSFDDKNSTINIYFHSPKMIKKENGGTVLILFSYDSYYNNAYAKSPENAPANAYMFFGVGNELGNPQVGLNTVTHEFTHMVTAYRPNGMLVYEGESGAINEGYSDVMAEVAEYYIKGSNDWLYDTESNYKGYSYLRNISNPKIAGPEGPKPTTYGKGDAWISPNNTDIDNGGVHINNSIFTYWFYLLSEGGKGTNDNNDYYEVTGIGIELAAKIAWRMHRQYLPKKCTFSNARELAIKSVRDLLDGVVGTPEEKAVTNAWYAVGVGDKYPEDITIKATMPASWGNTISAWVWEDSSNGSWATLTKQGDWYSYSKSCDKLNIIFVNGATWSEDNNQTVDISTSSSICCQISDNKTGKRNYTIVDCEENDDTQQFIVLAQRNTNSNWFYMTADLGTAGTKRFQAIDAATPDKSKINTSPTDTKYIWSFKEVDGGVALVNGEQYASWKSGNSAILSAIPMALNITDISEDQVNMSFVDGEGNTRYLSLNATEGNNYFAFYKGTTQKCNLLIIPYGEKIVADVQSNISIETSSVQKLLRNGQLLILLDGKTYNAQGALIK